MLDGYDDSSAVAAAAHVMVARLAMLQDAKGVKHFEDTTIELGEEVSITIRIKTPKKVTL